MFGHSERPQPCVGGVPCAVGRGAPPVCAAGHAGWPDTYPAVTAARRLARDLVVARWRAQTATTPDAAGTGAASSSGCFGFALTDLRAERAGSSSVRCEAFFGAWCRRAGGRLAADLDLIWDLLCT